jgi:hypothetical protein
MPQQEIGPITYMRPSSVFKNEKEFTRWLNEHLNILGEKLNIDMIDSNIEEPIGSYYCDITALDSNTEEKIVIETQYNQTNHDHLGKILTYAAGRDARIIIWIAETIKEEHKKALEWINENSSKDSGISFFAIQLKILKIKDSQPAIDFDVIVRPIDWGNKPSITSETNKKYLDFFAKLIDRYSRIQSGFRKKKPQPCSWLSFGAGKAGLSFGWAFRGNKRFSIELYIDFGDKVLNEKYLVMLEEYSGEIETKLAVLGEVSWEKLEDKRACRIAVYKGIKEYMRNLNESDFSEIIDWGTDAMKIFSDTFSEYIDKLE